MDTSIQLAVQSMRDLVTSPEKDDEAWASKLIAVMVSLSAPGCFGHSTLIRLGQAQNKLEQLNYSDVPITPLLAIGTRFQRIRGNLPDLQQALALSSMHFVVHRVAHQVPDRCHPTLIAMGWEPPQAVNPQPLADHLGAAPLHGQTSSTAVTHTTRVEPASAIIASAESASNGSKDKVKSKKRAREDSSSGCDPGDSPPHVCSQRSQVHLRALMHRELLGCHIHR